MTIAGTGSDLCIWDGPVWAGILDSVHWSAPTTILTLPCTGSTGCAALSPGGKRVLWTLLAQHNLKPEQFNKIIVAGFSAGHGLNESILSDADSCARVDAVCACDSYYTGPKPGIKHGYDMFAARAVAGDAVLWTSCSSFPGPGYCSCMDAIAPLVAKYALAPDDLPALLSQQIAVPVACKSRGAWAYAAYGDHYKHAEHATVVAPAVLGLWISPALHNKIALPGAWLDTLLKLGAAAGVAYGAWWLAKRWLVK